ncbi:unnamed protein product [Angiostrongylus costaricensis]|uniref:Trafficking protein particle complex subunit n=1 Tax=Angiostrongylus costaricensis TaxID=334426 RepID=A0A0R3Q0Q3_ANGCS|nr:unnamed protein product [Angiostrongylus costaricensis]
MDSRCIAARHIILYPGRDDAVNGNHEYFMQFYSSVGREAVMSIFKVLGSPRRNGITASSAINHQASTMQLAEELRRICHESYLWTATHIGPEMFYFREDDEATSNFQLETLPRTEILKALTLNFFFDYIYTDMINTPLIHSCLPL